MNGRTPTLAANYREESDIGELPFSSFSHLPSLFCDIDLCVSKYMSADLRKRGEEDGLLREREREFTRCRIFAV